MSPALQILLIVLGALAAIPFVRLATRQVERRLEKTTADLERVVRLKTLVQAGRGAAGVLIFVVAGLMILQALSLNITPLLAGAGVAGLALSLGAQTLIKDYIGGILVLAENQFRVGDVIQVGDETGVVERITLRATHLRDVEGKLHIVPNGEIRIVSNLTKDWSRAIVDLSVPFDADFGKVIRALEAAAAQAQADETIKAHLLEPPQALGWVGFKDWAVQTRLMAKTAPGKQWEVMIALRRYALEALGAEGVPVALPAQTIRLDGTVGDRPSPPD